MNGFAAARLAACAVTLALVVLSAGRDTCAQSLGRATSLVLSPVEESVSSIVELHRGASANR